MRVLVSASAHFNVTPDGALWTANEPLGYPLWERYLEVFDEVRLVARATACPSPPAGWKAVTGPGVHGVPVPDFVGPWGFVKHYRAMKRIAVRALGDVEAVQLRLPCPIGGIIWQALAPGRPYGVEVVADPYDSFAPGAVRHPLRRFFRWLFPRELRQQCARACAAAYVTAEALQRRYPCPSYSVGFSDVFISAAALVREPRPVQPDRRTITLITVGSLAQLYKAPDVLIDAVAACVHQGLDLKLVLVGDGKYRSELSARAAGHGIAARVAFLGQLTAGDPIRAELDRADLFVLPSRQEGLPKAMIEAMARALPCIGSSVGGIPELLAAEDLVPAGDTTALARKIREIVADPLRLARMSARNLVKANEFREEELGERRRAFYRVVRDHTDRWLASTRSSSSPSGAAVKARKRRLVGSSV